MNTVIRKYMTNAQVDDTVTCTVSSVYGFLEEVVLESAEPERRHKEWV